VVNGNGAWIHRCSPRILGFKAAINHSMALGGFWLGVTVCEYLKKRGLAGWGGWCEVTSDELNLVYTTGRPNCYPFFTACTSALHLIDVAQAKLLLRDAIV